MQLQYSYNIIMMAIHVPEVQIWLCKGVDLTFNADADKTSSQYDLYLNIHFLFLCRYIVVPNYGTLNLLKNRKYKKVFNRIKRIWLNQHIWSNIVMSQSVLADRNPGIRHYININSIKSKIRKTIVYGCYKKRRFPVQQLAKM